MPPLVLSDEEVQQLQSIANSPFLPPFAGAASADCDELRSGRPRTYEDDQVAEVINRALQT